jgi:hypothetical protein
MDSYSKLRVDTLPKIQMLRLRAPAVFATIDQWRGHAAGGDISGFNIQDRMVMGLLRAVADVVIAAGRHRRSMSSSAVADRSTGGCRCFRRAGRK